MRELNQGIACDLGSGLFNCLVHDESMTTNLTYCFYSAYVERISYTVGCAK